MASPTQDRTASVTPEPQRIAGSDVGDMVSNAPSTAEATGPLPAAAVVSAIGETPAESVETIEALQTVETGGVAEEIAASRGAPTAARRNVIPAASSSPAIDKSKAAQGTFAALGIRNYRLFWLGQVVSVTGTFMQGTAQQWLVLTLSKNPLALGIVGALQFAPLLLLGPFVGIVVDRWPRRTLLVITQTSASILAVALWLLTVTHEVRLWHVFVLAALLGLVNALDMPTRQAFISEMVPTNYLLNAVSLNSVQFNVARILGPAVAGALIALLGVPTLFLLNAISFIAVIIGLLMMREAELVPIPRSASMDAHGLRRLRAIGDGARFIWNTPSVRVTFLLLTVVGTLGFNFNVSLPLEATGVLHAGPTVFGLLSSALGVGALVGALALARRGGAPTNRMLIGTTLAFGGLEAAIGLTHALPLVMLLIAATGCGMSMFSASANTRTQLSTPAEMRGRVMSVYSMIFMGSTPIGNLLVSVVASTGCVPLSFLVMGVPCVAAGLVAAWLWRAQPTPTRENVHQGVAQPHALAK